MLLLHPDFNGQLYYVPNSVKLRPGISLYLCNCFILLTNLNNLLFTGHLPEMTTCCPLYSIYR